MTIHHFRTTRQEGFALIMSLITMVILTISALAMMMLLKSGVSAAGNIAFRQAATRVADTGVEDARTWLQGQSTTTLQTDSAANAANGYYATFNSSFTPQSYDFYNFVTKAPKNARYAGNFSGYDVYYVIHRMAEQALACSDTNAGCMYPPAASSAGPQEGASMDAGSSSQAGYTPNTGLVYYRVTVKVVGPRFNNRYVQAFLY